MSNSPQDQMFQMLMAYWHQEYPDDPTDRNNCRRITQKIEATLSKTELIQLRSNPTSIESKLRVFWESLLTQDPTIRVLLPKPLKASSDVLASNPEVPSLPLTLRFIEQDKGFQILWESEAFGSLKSQFENPYDSVTLKEMIEDLEFAQQWAMNPTHQSGVLQMQEIHREVGRKLLEALTKDPIGTRALQSIHVYAAAQDKVIHYILRIPPPMIEIAALPWELLWDDYGPIMLSQGKVAFCTRYPDFDLPNRPGSFHSRKLHILAIAPEVAMDPEIRKGEQEAHRQALQPLIQNGLAMVHDLYPATLYELNNYINTNPPVDVIHFYGHGNYKDGHGVLFFDNPRNNKGQYIRADQIAMALGGIPLVVLHACRSSMVSDGGLLTAVAPALSAAGVPAVIGMQLSIQARHATRFSGIVYEALAKGASLHRAVGLGRKVLYSEEGSGAGWYVPTLTLRSSEPMYLIRNPKGK
jgi:hypothetical protein